MYPTSSPTLTPTAAPYAQRASLYPKRAPGTFDTRWTLYNRGLLTEYPSPYIVLASGGDYTLESGLEIEINGVRTDQPGTLEALDKIRVFATTLNEYFVDGVSGTLALKLTIDGVDCTFTMINIVDPAAFIVDGADFIVDGADYITDGA